jgi:hypothetical protein
MIERNRELYEICAASTSAYRIPLFDYRGTPTGIDVLRVLETGILPAMDVGIPGRDGGQIGAGFIRAPRECFELAGAAYARALRRLTGAAAPRARRCACARCARPSPRRRLGVARVDGRVDLVVPVVGALLQPPQTRRWAEHARAAVLDGAGQPAFAAIRAPAGGSRVSQRSQSPIWPSAPLAAELVEPVEASSSVRSRLSVRRSARRRAAIGSTASRKSMMSSNSRWRSCSSSGAGLVEQHDAAGRAAADLDGALALQHAHRLADRRARHAELARQVALRRQLVAGQEVAELDRSAAAAPARARRPGWWRPGRGSRADRCIAAAVLTVSDQRSISGP